MRFGSLFSGIGGLDLGLEWAGMQPAWQVEVDPYCLKVLEKHWPEVKRYGDIRQIKWEEVEKVDLVCGGFPCQPFSVAGKRKGAADERNLWPEMLRAIRGLRPYWILGENVPGIGDYLDTICTDLEGEGYEVLPLEIPVAAFGAPHLRYRLFIIGHRPEQSRIVAHADGRRCPQCNEDEWRVPKSNTEDWWAVESRVRRMVDGISKGLHGGGIDGQMGSTQGGAEGIQGGRVRGMRFDVSSPETPSESGRSSQGGDSVSEAPCDGRPTGRHTTPEAGADLRDLRDRVPTRRFSYAQDLRPQMLERVGKTVGPEALGQQWADGEWPDVPRIAMGVAYRVDRLRCLGNAAVPRVAEWLGRMILKAEEE